MVTLQEIKTNVSTHLKQELNILEQVQTLSPDDSQKFVDWYNNNTTVNGLKEIYEIVVYVTSDSLIVLVLLVGMVTSREMDNFGDNV
jgi:hypothetical protein